MFYNEFPTKKMFNPHATSLLSSSSIKNKISPLYHNRQFIQSSTGLFSKPITEPFLNNKKNEYVLLYLKVQIDLIIQLINFPIKI